MSAHQKPLNDRLATLCSQIVPGANQYMLVLLCMLPQPLPSRGIKAADQTHTSFNLLGNSHGDHLHTHSKLSQSTSCSLHQHPAVCVQLTKLLQQEQQQQRPLSRRPGPQAAGLLEDEPQEASSTQYIYICLYILSIFPRIYASLENI